MSRHAARRAILGYTQSYALTDDKSLLVAACGLAEYFLLRLESDLAALRWPWPTEGAK
jgi:hypothetical protein